MSTSQERVAAEEARERAHLENLVKLIAAVLEELVREDPRIFKTHHAAEILARRILEAGYR